MKLHSSLCELTSRRLSRVSWQSWRISQHRRKREVPSKDSLKKLHFSLCELARSTI